MILANDLLKREKEREIHSLHSCFLLSSSSSSTLQMLFMKTGWEDEVRKERSCWYCTVSLTDVKDQRTGLHVQNLLPALIAGMLTRLLYLL